VPAVSELIWGFLFYSSSIFFGVGKRLILMVKGVPFSPGSWVILVELFATHHRRRFVILVWLFATHDRQRFVILFYWDYLLLTTLDYFLSVFYVLLWCNLFAAIEHTWTIILGLLCYKVGVAIGLWLSEMCFGLTVYFRSWSEPWYLEEVNLCYVLIRMLFLILGTNFYTIIFCDRVL